MPVDIFTIGDLMPNLPQVWAPNTKHVPPIRNKTIYERLHNVRAMADTPPEARECFHCQNLDFLRDYPEDYNLGAIQKRGKDQAFMLLSMSLNNLTGGVNICHNNDPQTETASVINGLKLIWGAHMNNFLYLKREAEKEYNACKVEAEFIMQDLADCYMSSRDRFIQTHLFVPYHLPNGHNVYYTVNNKYVIGEACLNGWVIVPMCKASLHVNGWRTSAVELKNGPESAYLNPYMAALDFCIQYADFLARIIWENWDNQEIWGYASVYTEGYNYGQAERSRLY